MKKTLRGLAAAAVLVVAGAGVAAAGSAQATPTHADHGSSAVAIQMLDTGWGW